MYSFSITTYHFIVWKVLQSLSASSAGWCLACFRYLVIAYGCPLHLCPITCPKNRFLDMKEWNCFAFKGVKIHKILDIYTHGERQSMNSVLEHATWHPFILTNWFIEFGVCWLIDARAGTQAPIRSLIPEMSAVCGVWPGWSKELQTPPEFLRVESRDANLSRAPAALRESVRLGEQSQNPHADTVNVGCGGALGPSERD